MARQGVRAEWSRIPESVRAALDAELGSPVVSATNLDGGFSPGPAARCELADGRTVFIKAAGSDLNPFTPAMHRREIEVLASLPSAVPAPRLLGSVDIDDWVAIIVEWVDGAPPPAVLDEESIDRTLNLVEHLRAASRDLDVSHLRPLGDDNATLSSSWARLADDAPTTLDEWSRRHLDDLVLLESGVPEATAGDELLHLDLRTDNMLFATGGPEFDVVVDWPSACRGAGWVDLLTMLPSFHLDGAPEPDAVLAMRSGALIGDGPPVDGGDVDAFVAGLAGYFTRYSLLPPPPGLPTVRAFQAAQAEVTREWLGRRLGWS